jgi:hypothetical protein
MAGFSNAAMVDAANAIRTKYVYAQLHSAAAGGSGTSNVTTAARQSFTWAAATSNGDFDISAAINFTGGAASGAVYSVSIWSAVSAGTFGGEFVLTGDTAFNAAGEYTVNSIAQDGSAS